MNVKLIIDLIKLEQQTGEPKDQPCIFETNCAPRALLRTISFEFTASPLLCLSIPPNPQRTSGKDTVWELAETEAGAE